MGVEAGAVPAHTKQVSTKATGHDGHGLSARLLKPFIVHSSSGTAVPYLDGIRGIAVLMIVVFHSWALGGSPTVVASVPLFDRSIDLTPYLVTGYTGVDLFFVLSGFLLAQSWFRAEYLGKPRPSVQRYLRHRIFRIVPAYYCCLFIMLLFMAPTFIPPEFIYSKLGALLLSAHLLFIQQFMPITSGSYNVNGSLWTLSIEMLFYMILPWVVILFYRNRWRVTLPIAAILSMIWLYLCDHSMNGFVAYLQGTVAQYGVTEPIIRDYLSRQMPSYFLNFALGIILANLFVRYQLDLDRHLLARFLTGPFMSALCFVVGWVLVLYSMYESSKRGFFFTYTRHVTIPLGFTLVIASLLVGSDRLQRGFGFTPLRFIGIVGYSAYLWHMPLIYIFNKFPTIAALPPPERFPHVLAHVAVALTILSALFYLAIEKPFMLFGRRDARVVAPRTVADPIVTAAEVSDGSPVRVPSPT